MTDQNVLAQWLGDRSFYAGLILVLLVIGLVLALARRRRPGSRPTSAKAARPRRMKR